MKRKQNGPAPVAVIGAGIGGCVSALCLARAGAGVCVFEARHRGRPPVAETLAPVGRTLLTRMGVGTACFPESHECCDRVRALWSNEYRERHYTLEPHGPAWHVDRQRLDGSVQRAAEECGARFYKGVSITGISRTAHGWFIEGRCGATARRWGPFAAVLDASGRRRILSRALGIAVQRHDSLLGMRRVFRLPALRRAPSETAIESFRQGWWHAAPLGEDRISVTLFTDKEIAAQAGLRNPANWLTAFAGTKLINPLVVSAAAEVSSGPVQCLDAAGDLAARNAGDGWAFIGDAGGSLDPLTGHGLIAAIGSAHYAAAATLGYLGGDQAAFLNFDQLMGIERTRYADTVRTFYQTETRWAGEPFWAARR